MTSLSAYHFPETDITLGDVRRQLLFFSQIFYLTPVEAEEADESKLLTPFTPAPLGDDLQRFQQLIAELKGNEAAFYQGQLSNMALDFMENRDPESVRDIISNLQAPETATASPSSSPQDRQELWQARLLLKLAEMLRQEQKEVAEGIALMQDRQAELLKDLKGEEELQDLFHALTDTPSNQFPVRVESLIRAWGHLLLAGDHKPWFLNCFSPEAAEPFFEANEKLCDQRPVRLMRLPLPNCDQDPENYSEKRQAWLDQLREWHQQTADILHSIVHNGMADSTLADLAQLAASWTATYSQNNPWPEPPAPSDPKKCKGSPHLEIYFFNRPILQLMAHLCGGATKSESENDMNYGLIAILSSRTSTCQG